MLELSLEAEFADPIYPDRRIVRLGAMTVRRQPYAVH